MHGPVNVKNAGNVYTLWFREQTSLAFSTPKY